MRLPRRLLRDRVVLTALEGSGPYGEVWRAPVIVWGSVQVSNTLLPGTSGDADLTTTVTVWLPPAAALVDGSGHYDATSITPEHRLVVGGEKRELHSVQTYRVRGVPVAVELLTT